MPLPHRGVDDTAVDRARAREPARRGRGAERGVRAEVGIRHPPRAIVITSAKCSGLISETRRAPKRASTSLSAACAVDPSVVLQRLEDLLRAVRRIRCAAGRPRDVVRDDFFRFCRAHGGGLRGRFRERRRAWLRTGPGRARFLLRVGQRLHQLQDRLELGRGLGADPDLEQAPSPSVDGLREQARRAAWHLGDRFIEGAGEADERRTHRPDLADPWA